MDEEAVAKNLNRLLIESGEYERLKELLRTRLTDSGWKEGLFNRCKEDITKSSPYSLDNFVQKMLPEARATGSMKPKFKDEFPFEKRLQKSTSCRKSSPDRIPVICEKLDKSDLPDIEGKKFLVPGDLTVAHFAYVIRRRINLSSDKAIFLFINNSLPPTHACMSVIYEQHKDPDGFLYVIYSGENTFGIANNK